MGLKIKCSFCEFYWRKGGDCHPEKMKYGEKCRNEGLR